MIYVINVQVVKNSGGVPHIGGHHTAENLGCPDTLDTMQWTDAYGAYGHTQNDSQCHLPPDKGDILIAVV